MVSTMQGWRAWLFSNLPPFCVSDSCPHLAVPMNGRKLGRKSLVGHEVHFLCDAGFHLVGSETRTCLDNRTWSGQQPFCKSEVLAHEAGATQGFMSGQT